MCSLIAFLFLVECDASKNSLLFHWGYLSKIVISSRSKSCPVCRVCLAKREFRSRVAMALECSRFLVSKSCPVSSACLAKREFRSRVAMALECSRFLVSKSCPVSSACLAKREFRSRGGNGS